MGFGRVSTVGLQAKRLKPNNRTQSLMIFQPLEYYLWPFMKSLMMDRTMMDQDITMEVTEAIYWCAPILCELKVSIRLCIHFSKLNEHVIRERFVLPTTNETIYKIQG